MFDLLGTKGKTGQQEHPESARFDMFRHKTQAVAFCVKRRINGRLALSVMSSGF